MPNDSRKQCNMFIYHDSLHGLYWTDPWWYCYRDDHQWSVYWASDCRPTGPGSAWPIRYHCRPIALLNIAVEQFHGNGRDNLAQSESFWDVAQNLLSVISTSKYAYFCKKVVSINKHWKKSLLLHLHRMRMRNVLVTDVTQSGQAFSGSWSYCRNSLKLATLLPSDIMQKMNKRIPSKHTFSVSGKLTTKVS